jgi:quercetin dioxygenase-like cupin family protein
MPDWPNFLGAGHVLERGDAIFFKADAPHEYANEGQDEAVAYLVTTSPATESRHSGERT